MSARAAEDSMGIKGLRGGRSLAPRGMDYSSAADASLSHLVVKPAGVFPYVGTG